MKKQAFLFLFIFPSLTVPLFSSETALQGKIIVVDPGHGTLDFEDRIINPGKQTKDGIMEHQLNIEIATELGETLKREGAKVYFTRTKRDYWRQGYSTVEDNKTRAFFANSLKAHAYISVHCDWHPYRSVHGVTTLYSQKNSRQLGNHIQKRLVQKLKAKNRKVVKNDFTVLDNAKMPAVIIESGFMSHRRESKKLSNPNYQKKIAQAVTEGLNNYFKEVGP